LACLAEEKKKEFPSWRGRGSFACLNEKRKGGSLRLFFAKGEKKKKRERSRAGLLQVIENRKGLSISKKKKRKEIIIDVERKEGKKKRGGGGAGPSISWCQKKDSLTSCM